ncbi:hypothetical protein Aduo_012463 [Ancylostoma duodenale]
MLYRIAHKRQPKTILHGETTERLADFEKLDATDEGYDKLVDTVTTIKDDWRKKNPNHITSTITVGTQQLFKKKSNLKGTTHSHLEMILLNKLCRERGYSVESRTSI